MGVKSFQHVSLTRKLQVTSRWVLVLNAYRRVLSFKVFKWESGWATVFAAGLVSWARVVASDRACSLSRYGGAIRK